MGYHDHVFSTHVHEIFLCVPSLAAAPTLCLRARLICIFIMCFFIYWRTPKEIFSRFSRAGWRFGVSERVCTCECFPSTRVNGMAPSGPSVSFIAWMDSAGVRCLSASGWSTISLRKVLHNGWWQRLPIVTLECASTSVRWTSTLPIPYKLEKSLPKELPRPTNMRWSMRVWIVSHESKIVFESVRLDICKKL